MIKKGIAIFFVILFSMSASANPHKAAALAAVGLVCASLFNAKVADSRSIQEGLIKTVTLVGFSAGFTLSCALKAGYIGILFRWPS